MRTFVPAARNAGRAERRLLTAALFLILPCLVTSLATASGQLEPPVYFQKTRTQQEPLIDEAGSSDNQATARWNLDGSLTAWFCGSEVFPNQQRHDAIMTSTVRPGESDLSPQVAIHSSGSTSANHDRWDSLNVCSPSVVDKPAPSGPDWTLLYYECSSVVFDLSQQGGNPSGPFISSFVQVCLARNTANGWRLYNEDLWNSQGVFGDPLTTKPTPVVRIRPETVTEGQLADDSETTPGTFVPPIDGHLYGNDAQLGSIRHYGVGHPAAVLHTLQDGSNEIWLYYWDSVVHRMSRVRSQDGIYFDPADRLVTNITHPSDIKFFPDLEIDGQQGVWIGTSIFAGRRWFEYSFDGELFQATTANHLEESFALGIANTGYLCPVPGAGSFVSDRYGHVQGIRRFGFLSGEGFRSLNENGVQLGCHHPDEDQLRGSTWGIHYLEGDFSDVDITNGSCEDGSLGQPYGLVSQGTTIPGWQVDNPKETRTPCIYRHLGPLATGLMNHPG